MKTLAMLGLVIMVLSVMACSGEGPQPDLRATITALEAELATPRQTPTPEVVYATPETVYVTVVVTPPPTPALPPTPTPQPTTAPTPTPTPHPTTAPTPTPTPQPVFIDTAQMEALIFDLVNLERRAANLHDLLHDALIAEIARVNSDAMVQQGHVQKGSGGKALARADEAGYTCPRQGYLFGEVTGESVEPPGLRLTGLEEKHAQMVVAAWMTDPVRRSALLSPDIRVTGIGVSVEQFAGHGWDTHVYVTVNYSSCRWTPPRS